MAQPSIEFENDAWDAFISMMNGLQGFMVRVVGVEGLGTRSGMVQVANDNILLISDEDDTPITINWKDIKKIKVL